MQSFGKKRRGKAYELTLLGGKVAGIALLSFLAFITARAAWGMYEKFAEASEGRAAAQSEVEELQKKKEGIEASVAGLSSSRGMEAQIRERFGVAKAGEGEIRIVRDEEGALDEGASPANVWEWIVDTFFVW